MIEEIEGATTEPPRRGHVIALSAAAAAAALAVLVAILVPAPRTVPRTDGPSLVGAPASSSTSWVMLIDSGATVVRLDELSQLRDDVLTAACVAGPGSSPPIHMLFDRSGRPIAAYTSGSTGRFIPLRPEYRSSGWLTVPCDTGDIFAPRMNRAR